MSTLLLIADYPKDRDLNEAIANSLLMACEVVAKAKDIPEFDVYQESER